jgi:hypothetical protein
MKKSLKNLETKSIKTVATVKGGDGPGPITTAVVGSIAGVAVLSRP